MNTDEATSTRTRWSSVALTLFYLFCLALVVASVYVFYFVRIERQSYEVDVGSLLRGALALAGLLGLSLSPAHAKWSIAVLAITGAPGALMLANLAMGWLFGWSAGGTFIEVLGWSVVWFSLMSPWFIPALTAGLLLIIRNRPRWLRLTVIVLVVGGSCALSALSNLYW